MTRRAWLELIGWIWIAGVLLCWLTQFGDVALFLLNLIASGRAALK